MMRGQERPPEFWQGSCTHHGMTDAPQIKPERNLGPKIAFAVPALLLPLGVLVGSIANLSLPEPKNRVLPVQAASEPAPDRVRRTYVPIIEPLEMTLPDVGKGLGIQLAVALPANEDPEIRKFLMGDPQAVLAGLVTIALDLWATLGPDQDIAKYRRTLPPLLAHEMNMRLRELGISDTDPVLEVLIMEFNMAH